MSAIAAVAQARLQRRGGVVRGDLTGDELRLVPGRVEARDGRLFADSPSAVPPPCHLLHRGSSGTIQARGAGPALVHADEVGERRLQAGRDLVAEQVLSWGMARGLPLLSLVILRRRL